MNISDLSQWFWPTLSALLALLWLRTLRLLRRRERKEPKAAAAPRLQRVEAEDVLKAAYAQKEEDSLNVERLADAVGLPAGQVERGLQALLDFGWVAEGAAGDRRLTEQGKARARELIRAHRLWERYLVEREEMPMEAIHAEAHHREHTTTPEELERLDAELGHPAWDPHGHAIPAPDSDVPASPGHPLSEEAEPGRRLRICCLDDDPAPLLAQLVALGLEPGATIEVTEVEPDLLRLRVDGDVIPVARTAAERVSVVTAPRLPLELGRLPVGARARVVDVKGSGKQQRRMLDMGFVPGAEVTVMRMASLGDPIEYRIKGTGVAMRRADADNVMVEEVGNG